MTALPFAELWTERGTLAARVRRLGRTEIVALLQFVVADVGRPLDWVPPVER